MTPLPHLKIPSQTQFVLDEDAYAYGGGWALSATAGFIIGRTDAANQLYFSASVGRGFTLLSKDDECLSCTGGASYGPALRLAIGFTGDLHTHTEIVFMTTGGDASDEEYPNDEEVFLSALLIQLSY